MSFFGVVVETAMNVTFPTLMDQFDVTTSTVQWITTGYLLVLAVVVPTSAYLNRNVRTRTLFIVAASLFGAGTLLCALAPTFFLLLAGRLLEGVGTGIALPLMINIVIEQTPLNRMGMVMGIAMTVPALSPAVGPVLGGFIVTQWGWRWVFAAIEPFVVLALICGALTIRQSHPTARTPFAWTQLLVLTIGFTALLLGLNQASIYGWFSLPVLALFVVTVVALLTFGYLSNRSRRSLLNLAVFTSAPFCWSVLGIFLMQFSVLALGYLIPNHAQLVNSASAFVSGCLLLPGCLVGALFAPFAGRILDSLGARIPLIAGSLIMWCACTLMAALSYDLALGRVTWLYVVFAAGQGFAAMNTVTFAITQVDGSASTDANAVITTLQQLAGAVGTAVVTTIVSAYQSGSTGDDLVATTQAGCKTSLWVIAALMAVAVGAVIAALRTSKPARS